MPSSIFCRSCSWSFQSSSVEKAMKSSYSSCASAVAVAVMTWVAVAVWNDTAETNSVQKHQKGPGIFCASEKWWDQDLKISVNGDRFHMWVEDVSNRDISRHAVDWPLALHVRPRKERNSSCGSKTIQSSNKPWFNKQNDRVDFRPVNISQP